jgi:hypothetical protein
VSRTRVRRVAFGNFATWTDSIRRDLDARYTPSFLDLSLIRLEDFDAVIPLQIAHYDPLFSRPELRGIKFLHPSLEVVHLCDDKLRLTQFLIAEGFGDYVPRMRAPGAPYPYVLKRRQGWWGLHCHIVNGVEDEHDLDLSLNLSDDAWFAQEFVTGEAEFATHILRAGGKIRYASTVAYEMATPSGVKGAPDTPIQTRTSRLRISGPLL